MTNRLIRLKAISCRMCLYVIRPELGRLMQVYKAQALQPFYGKGCTDMYLGYKTHMHSVYTNININSFEHTRPDSPVCKLQTSTVLKTIIMSLKIGGLSGSSLTFTNKHQQQLCTAELVVNNYPGATLVNSL